MKKFLTVFLLFPFLLFAEDIAVVKMVEGHPIVRRGNDTISVKVGDVLQEKDILITDSGSKIGAIFDDGSTITLGESSFLNIEAYKFSPIEEKYKFSLNLDKGQILFESGKIGDLAPESFELKIPDGAIGIRGTKFLVKLN
ncbi:MAG: FecR domain-containing protein [Campylobacteraceae bacterium]|nr:FecR domain-containing protein [Campylobacteraceae bacterium]